MTAPGDTILARYVPRSTDLTDYQIATRIDYDECWETFQREKGHPNSTQNGPVLDYLYMPWLLLYTEWV